MTRQPDFTGIWIKIERAKHHLSDLEARIERFVQAEPYRTASYCELDTGDLVHRFEVTEQPPLLWGAIAGDCVHNLLLVFDVPSGPLLTFHVIWVALGALLWSERTTLMRRPARVE